MIYYEFLKLKTIFGINKRFSKKENHTVSHVAASGRATCHANISTGSTSADVIMTSVLTWSTLTMSTVNRSTSERGQLGPCVSGAVSLMGGPHTSGLIKEKEKGERV